MPCRLYLALVGGDEWRNPLCPKAGEALTAAEERKSTMEACRQAIAVKDLSSELVQHRRDARSVDHEDDHPSLVDSSRPANGIWT